MIVKRAVKSLAQHGVSMERDEWMAEVRACVRARRQRLTGRRCDRRKRPKNRVLFEQHRRWCAKRLALEWRSVRKVTLFVILNPL